MSETKVEVEVVKVEAAILDVKAGQALLVKVPSVRFRQAGFVEHVHRLFADRLPGVPVIIHDEHAEFSVVTQSDHEDETHA